jgi:hypothetical protein
MAVSSGKTDYVLRPTNVYLARTTHIGFSPKLKYSVEVGLRERVALKALA